jgi:hypothetical protein
MGLVTHPGLLECLSHCWSAVAQQKVYLTLTAAQHTSLTNADRVHALPMIDASMESDLGRSPR